MTLTKEQILSMPAGRELDALVAEKVMGDHPEDGWWHSTDGSKISTDDGGPRFYSTAIAAAWAVVESGRWADADGYCRWYWMLRQLVTVWEVTLIYRPTSGRNPVTRIVETEADTAPLAICRAALLATL